MLHLYYTYALVDQAICSNSVSIIKALPFKYLDVKSNEMLPRILFRLNVIQSCNGLCMLTYCAAASHSLILCTLYMIRTCTYVTPLLRTMNSTNYMSISG